METVAKSDIFFVISSVGFILLTLAWLLVAYFVIKAVQEFRTLVGRLHSGVNEVEEEIHRIRHTLRFSSKFLQRFFINIFRK